MMVIGLGNPGTAYDHTRHNLGFAVLDQIGHERELHWKADRTANVLVATFGLHLLLKPTAFMNLSGQAFMQFWKYRLPDTKPEPEQLVVVHDDLDLPLGEVREQFNRSAAGHRGVASLIEALGSQAFHRLRIGIGDNRAANIPAEDFVLQKFSATERPIIDEAVTQATQRLLRRLE